MTLEQVLNYVAYGLAVGAVVYGYVKNKNATAIVAEVNKTADQALQLQATIVNTLMSMKEPLEKAVKQLPKTRSRKVQSETDVDVEVQP